MTRALPALLPAAFAMLLLGGCKKQDMYDQPKSQTWDRNSFFAEGSTMRPMVPDTVSPDDADQPVPQPAAADPAMLRRGQERFDIACAPCHGRAGDGDGMVVERGFPRPPSFYAKRLREAKAAKLYDVITHGHGVMYSYADRVAPSDRWAIIAYIRALQLSRQVPRAALSAQDLAALGEGS
jgi:mono/diheme cytochrome c family protein